MKSKIKKRLISLFRIPYAKFDHKAFDYSFRKLSKYLILQKIIGFNRKVPWPVHFTSIIKAYHKIDSVTEPVGFSPFSYIDARNGLILEKGVLLAPRVSLISMNHDLYDYNTYKKSLPIILRKDCWIGSGSIVLPGVELGEHTIVGAGSVVTKSFKEGFQILGGNPAKVIKKLDKENIKETLNGQKSTD